jgi:type II secretory pathway component PulF
MLQRLADAYDEEVQTATQRLTALLEPVLIVVLAVVVGFIAFATILPILEVSNVL